MTLPALLLGFVLATFYGMVFHLWRGGGLLRMFWYLLLSWLGFALGQWIGTQLGWTFDVLGPLHLGTSTAVTFIFLIVGYWLSKIDLDGK